MSSDIKVYCQLPTRDTEKVARSSKHNIVGVPVPNTEDIRSNYVSQ